MQIDIEFSKTWTVDEVKEFLLNPNDKEYPDMPYDVYYELLACAACYVEQCPYPPDNDADIDDHDLNEQAVNMVTTNIYDMMYDDFWGGCIAPSIKETRKKYYDGDY